LVGVPRAQSGLLLLVLRLPVALVGLAGIYMMGMENLEGEGRSFWLALGWAGETLTTTGYGADHTWDHPLMVIFVIVVQLAGVFLVFLIFPIYLIPVLEERFEARLPRRAPKDLEEHVVVYRYGPAVESVLEQLRARKVPALVLETDEGTARSIREREISVVFQRTEEEALAEAHLDRARALVANGRDEENAAVILGARQMGFEGEIVALVEEPMHRKPLTLAGASSVFTPRHMLAAALAARASERISPRLSGIQQLGRLEVRELRVRDTSPLAGKTLEDAAIGARTGATVIGQWVGGRLQAPPTADMRLEPRGIMVVVGSAEALEKVEDLAEGTTPLRREGPFVIAGLGEVGKKVKQLLTDVGEPVVGVDRQAFEEVDLVGDVLDAAVLERAGVRESQGVIVALDRDDLTLFTTVVAKDMAPDAPVIARVNQASNLEKIHRAGADFALSISQVSAQILSRRLLGEEALALDPLLKVQKVSPDGLVGRHPAELAIRPRTGASVVAVERGDRVTVNLDSDFRFQDDDCVFLCGSEEALRRFGEEFG
ncbi:MAG: NAD-binding protein, partial [Thermoanaerobaculia bacterium]|nr:NAD-binding protein [Thermoanaerobaculia bacterium]